MCPELFARSEVVSPHAYALAEAGLVRLHSNPVVQRVKPFKNVFLCIIKIAVAVFAKNPEARIDFRAGFLQQFPLAHLAAFDGEFLGRAYHRYACFGLNDIAHAVYYRVFRADYAEVNFAFVLFGK